MGRPPRSPATGHTCLPPASWAGCFAPRPLHPPRKEPLESKWTFSALQPSDQPWLTQGKKEASGPRRPGRRANVFRPSSTDQVFQRWVESKGQPAPTWPPALQYFFEKALQDPRLQVASPSAGGRQPHHLLDRIRICSSARRCDSDRIVLANPAAWELWRPWDRDGPSVGLPPCRTDTRHTDKP